MFFFQFWKDGGWRETDRESERERSRERERYTERDRGRERGRETHKYQNFSFTIHVRLILNFRVVPSVHKFTSCVSHSVQFGPVKYIRLLTGPQQNSHSAIIIRAPKPYENMKNPCHVQHTFCGTRCPGPYRFRVKVAPPIAAHTRFHSVTVKLGLSTQPTRMVCTEIRRFRERVSRRCWRWFYESMPEFERFEINRNCYRHSWRRADKL